MVEIVAEISGNHGGDKRKAIAMIREAARCGCDYVKFQFYEPAHMPDRHEDDNDAMYRKHMVHRDWLEDLYWTADQFHIGLFASVFHPDAIEPLLEFDIPFIKFAAPSSTRLPIDLYYEMAVKIPADVGLIVSTNEADREDMKGLPYDHLLYCPGGYPPSLIFEDLTLIKLHYTGFSDHTKGIRAAEAALRVGAEMIEKHFKIDEECIDAAFSIDRNKMSRLCKIAHR